MKVINLYSRFFCILLAISSTQGCSIFEDPRDHALRKAQDFDYAGQYAAAEKTYQEAYRIYQSTDPLRLSLLLNEARFYLRRKNYKKTISLCEEGLKTCQPVFGPKDMINTSFLFVLASAYDNSKDYDKAGLLYKKIMSFAPDSACSSEFVNLLPMLKLGDIEFKKGNFLSALKWYESALSIDQKNEISRKLINYRLALCNIALRRNDKAAIYYYAALPRGPWDAAPKDIYDKCAKFLLSYGRPASAGSILKASKPWYKRHKEYEDWYCARSTPGMRCRLMDMYTENDYTLVEQIKNQAMTLNRIKSVPKTEDISSLQ